MRWQKYDTEGRIKAFIMERSGKGRHGKPTPERSPNDVMEKTTPAFVSTSNEYVVCSG